jgi:hypothetical protein
LTNSPPGWDSFCRISTDFEEMRLSQKVPASSYAFGHVPRTAVG